TLSKACPASSPASRRMPVPALPQSSGPSAGLSPSTPTPWTMRREAEGVSIRTPMRSKIAAVARVSSPSRKPSMVEVPSARAANITDRCETDLSPGMSRVPRSGCPAVATQCCGDCDIIAPSDSVGRRPGGQRRGSGHGDRVGTEHLDLGYVLLQLRQRLLHRLVVHVAGQVDEERVLP